MESSLILNFTLIYVLIGLCMAIALDEDTEYALKGKESLGKIDVNANLWLIKLVASLAIIFGWSVICTLGIFNHFFEEDVDE